VFLGNVGGRKEQSGGLNPSRKCPALLDKSSLSDKKKGEDGRPSSEEKREWDV